MNQDSLLKAFYQQLDGIYTVACIYALLEWDQQVYLPPAAIASRAKQIEFIERLRHAKLTDPGFIQTVDTLYQNIGNLDYPDMVNVRETHRLCTRQQKLSADFVGAKALACSEAFDAWAQARPKADYAAVIPTLQKVVDLNREEAELVGYTQCPYDALLDLFEPGAALSVIKPVLLQLGEALSEMLPALQQRFADVPAVEGCFPDEEQQYLLKSIMSSLGFNFEAGRLDTSAHPFSSTIGTGDQRITTRYSSDNFLSALYGAIHETGHAFYEMGLPTEYHGTPMGSAASLGVHESQSRFFENVLGRSMEFCEFLHGRLREFFPDFHSKSSPEMLWGILNKVSPSLIRVDADEVTYSLHIIVRMLLEEQLINERLTAKELPDAWNSLYEKYLNITPPDAKDGVMQDVHWYSGMIGYFPSYALGNLYGAFMLDSMRKDLPNYLDNVAHGDFSHVLAWLKTHVHEKGMQFTGTQLSENLSGKPFSEEAFLTYLRCKFGV